MEIEKKTVVNIRTTDGILIKEHDICLACWCAPKRCHAETIKKFIEKYL